MKCANCARKVRETIATVPHLSNVSVSNLSGRAYAQIDLPSPGDRTPADVQQLSEQVKQAVAVRAWALAPRGWSLPGLGLISRFDRSPVMGDSDWGTRPRNP